MPPPLEPPPSPPEEAALLRVGRRRNTGIADFFGVYRMTPKYAAGGGDPREWQLTCTHPEHNILGQPRCTKSRSVGFGGGEDLAVRMLKWWAVLGAQATDKTAHKRQWDEIVLPAFNAGGSAIPSSATLDEQAILEWPSSGAASSSNPIPGAAVVAPPAAAGPGAASSSGGSGSSGSAGGGASASAPAALGAGGKPEAGEVDAAADGSEPPAKHPRVE